MRTRATRPDSAEKTGARNSPERRDGNIPRREDPHCPRRTARRDEHRGALPQEGIAQSRYYGWSKEFLEAGKRRLAGDTAREATFEEVGPTFRSASVSIDGQFAYCVTPWRQ